VEFCPKKVLELDNEDKVKAARPQDCICCRLCELRCPDFAIEIELEDEGV
jgi:2-oxoglutarate ferredoxin oxidoreductase subunit delta